MRVLFVSRKYRIITFCICLTLLLSARHAAYAQAGTNKAADTAGIRIDTLIPSIVNKVAAYTFTIDRNTFFLRRKFNMTTIGATLPQLEKSIQGFKMRLEKRGGQMNLRSLNSGAIMLGEISQKLTDYKTILSSYSRQLSKNNVDVKKIITDPQLKIQVPDSILNEQIADLRTESLLLDSMQQVTLVRVNLLRNRVSVDLLQADDIVSDMSYLATSIKIGMWSPEEAPLFKMEAGDYHQSWSAITIMALERSARIIFIYIRGKWTVLTLSILVFIFITVWCLLNMSRIKRADKRADVLEPLNLLSRGVLVACLMGFFTYSPLFFANPTMSYLHANEMLRTAALFYLVFPYLTKPAQLLWVIFCVLWVYYMLDDILLEYAYGERWGLFVAGIFTIAVCIRIITYRAGLFIKIKESPATKSLVIFTLAQMTMSVIFNLNGNVTLAKIFGVSAVQCLMLGFSLKIFCKLVLEAIYLQSEAFHDSRFSDFINYTVLQHRFQRVLWILASIVWFLALLRNLTVYDLTMQFAGAFFSALRTIGNMTFTFESIAVFICIIWVSSVISNVINFFFGNKNVTYNDKRSGLGSVMLLVRLAIWSLGFFIAVAASGIPLDRLSLMIGALGVGIGFGLQNIVNNLVSGVILAFERPIQVGDQIEIGNKAGIVKEIGVRSSMIKSSEGADIIIPNGDLLSQHLINWTMQDRSKRVEFIIGIAYEADIRQVKTLIQETLKKNENILHPPEPVVILQAFSDLAINVRIMFWASELSQSGTLRSNVMIDVYDALTTAGIPMPYTKK